MGHLLYDHVDGYALFSVNTREDLVTSDEASPHCLSPVSFVKCVSHQPSVMLGLLSTCGCTSVYCASEHRDILRKNGFEPRRGDRLLRCARQNCDRMFKIPDNDESKVRLLTAAHNYSREKLEYDASTDDALIIQAYLMMAQIDREISMYMDRLKRVYAVKVPGMYDLCASDSDFLKVVKALELNQDFEMENMANIVELINLNSETSRTDAWGTTGGKLAEIVECKIATRERLVKYMDARLKVIAPNLRELIGTSLAMRFISHRGGLASLSMCPASTIQMLGAEAALFRSLRSRTPTPKHGFIYYDEQLLNTKGCDKGKISRALSTKVAIASKIDFFGSDRSGEYGKKMKKMVGDRIAGDRAKCTETVLREVMKRLKTIRNKKSAGNGLSSSKEAEDSNPTNEVVGENKRKRKCAD